jgi:hypothetical protein
LAESVSNLKTIWWVISGPCGGEIGPFQDLYLRDLHPQDYHPKRLRRRAKMKKTKATAMIVMMMKVMTEVMKHSKSSHSLDISYGQSMV